jgi:hypothetical protein
MRNSEARAAYSFPFAEKLPAVRALLRRLRDEERGVEGAPHIPDITSLQDPGQLGQLSLEEGVATAAKFFTATMLGLAKRV